MDHPPLPPLGALGEERGGLIPPVAGQRTTAGPPAHGRQGGRSLHPGGHDGEPPQARHEHRRPSRWMAAARLDAFEAGRLAGANRTQPLQGDALRFLQHAPVPDGQGQLALLLQMGQGLVRQVPQEPVRQGVRPLGRAQQVAQTLGARRCLGRGEDMGAQLAEQQPGARVSQTHNGHQGQEESADQSPVCLLIQPLLQRPDERLQQIGNLLPLPPPRPMPQHNVRPLPVNGVAVFPFHPKGSSFVPAFLNRFYCFFLFTKFRDDSCLCLWDWQSAR